VVVEGATTSTTSLVGAASTGSSISGAGKFSVSGGVVSGAARLLAGVKPDGHADVAVLAAPDVPIAITKDPAMANPPTTTAMTGLWFTFPPIARRAATDRWRVATIFGTLGATDFPPSDRHA
jgi:hypothetical protein